jgi:hypothetical protein
MRALGMAAVLAAWPAWGQAVLTEVVGEDSFNMPGLARICKSKLPVKPGQWLRLTIFASEPSPYYLQQSALESWASWLKAWRSAARVRWRVAEMTAIGNDAVLRIRVVRSASRATLSGRDPLVLDIGGRRYDILHISGAARATVYVRGPKPLPCEEIHRVLRRKLDGPVTVKVRTDPWFVRDPGFPAFYWFYSGEPPSREAVEAAQQAVCGG